MELIERAVFLSSLQSSFKKVETLEGHCILISGEAGIGKTSLVREFCKSKKDECDIYLGMCDALFTPRPLAPLYDIAMQLDSKIWHDNANLAERADLFGRFFHALSQRKGTTVIVFEDVHWADEATLDFIKFFARRITQVHCLFILTYRDNEIHPHHPLRNVLGQLPPDSFTRMQLPPLSKEAVEEMAKEKGYSGENVYTISGGNPFYVNEILASYSPGVPDNIKDSILIIYNDLDEKTRQVWQILSVFPTAFEVNYLEKMEPAYAAAIENCLTKKILIIDKGKAFFKHELYRRTVEGSLSPFLRVELNKRVLNMFLESFEHNHETERIIHHAKNANEYDLVVRYAPIAARQAASVGAHIEASRLFFSAIEYYQGNDKDLLIELYESYAYECYLTNQIKEAIIYFGKALHIWREKNNYEKIGDCMRYLSRLWWFEGNRKQAENFAQKSIEALEEQPSSKAKAMSYSNLAQLKMLSDESEECRHWGEKAIAIAKEVGDEETIAHALNSVGSALMTVSSSMEEGAALLQQSLSIALKNSYHEHVARAYAALGSNAVTMKDYVFAKKTLDEGINYCEENDLDSLKLYMLAWKARLNLETGHWNEAYRTAENLLKNDLLPVIKIGALVVFATIRIRKGEFNALPMLIEAKEKAFQTMELQRIVPALSALLEYEWITGNTIIEKEALDQTINMIAKLERMCRKNKFYYWLQKARPDFLPVGERYEDSNGKPLTALQQAAAWQQLGCAYEQALELFRAGDADKKKAISIVHELGADAVYEKLKQAMRTAGIKSIPRGIRKSTRANAAQLTGREMDVLQLVKEGMQNKEIAAKLYISAKTVDHHISSILFKLDVNSRVKAVQEAARLGIVK